MCRVNEYATDIATTELRELFRKTNPTYAVRAVIALWRLGRTPLVTDQLREAVATKDDTWGWAVLSAVADGDLAHGKPHKLSLVFVAAPHRLCRLR